MDDPRKRGHIRRSAEGGDLSGDRAKHIAGYRQIQLLRAPADAEVEFITIMWFDSWDAVREFAGEDYDCAYVPAKAQEVLARFDKRSAHYEVKARLEY